MQLTQFTDFGIRTLMYLAAHPDKSSSVREISEYYGISRNHLVKVVHQLAKLGYIISTKGKGGGIRLAEDAGQVKLGDLVVQLEPNMHIVGCFDRGTDNCRISNSCKLKHYLFEANAAFIATLNRYTLAEASRANIF